MQTVHLWKVLTVLFCYNVLSAAAYAEDASFASATYNSSSLFWGPYRPNLYVGIRPRLPNSLLAGLMWANVDTYENFHDLRHSCQQGDDIGGYGWEEYDARTGGRHVVRDIKMGIDLTTSFLKVHSDGKGHWVLRIKGTPREDASDHVRTTVLFYAGLEGEGQLHLKENFADDYSTGLPDGAAINGNSPGLGKFSISLLCDNDKNESPVSRHPLAQFKNLAQTAFVGLKVPGDIIWQAKEILLQSLRETLQKVQEQYNAQMPEPALLFSLPNAVLPDSNLYYLQRTFEGAFEFDIVYQTEEEHVPSGFPSSTYISKELKKMSQAFQTRFAEVFPLRAPYDGTKFVRFGKALFSNLLGGIGYFHGTSIIDRSYSSSYEEDEESFWESAAKQLEASAGVEEGPTTLFTAVPSRAFFPRGFYWDEGFHLLPIGLWDQDLSLEVIESWFSLMDEDGWIGREQILGAEARSKVPKEFTTQYPHYANPPTLFIAIDQFLKRASSAQAHSNPAGEYKFEADQMPLDYVKSAVTSEGPSPSRYLQSPDLSQKFLQTLYPKLKKHFEWFRSTQRGEVKSYDRDAFSTKEAYRWRGRTPDHCLTSGIDDYPRARPPHPGELHLDLHCWVGLMTKLLRSIAGQVGEVEDVTALSHIEEGILRNLDDLYWSQEHQAYCDQSIDDYEENVAVCHLGYISIFPVLLGLLPPDHERLGAVLTLMRDEQHLWSPYGLRSLSRSDPYYGTGENYWRGPIWININYLALASLYQNYIFVSGPHQELAKSIYDELRTNLITNTEREYRRTDVIWEQYNPETGHGQRTKAFTGWTSMIVNIMAEKY